MTASQVRAAAQTTVALICVGAAVLTGHAGGWPWTILFAVCAAVCTEGALTAHYEAADQRIDLARAWDGLDRECCLTAWATGGADHDPTYCKGNQQ